MKHILEYNEYNEYNDNSELILYHGTTALFDKFDLSFKKSGSGVNKYGAGIYLTDSFDTAVKHTKDILIGKKKYIYTIGINSKDMNNILNIWEDRIEYSIYLSILDTIKNIDKSLYETLNIDLEEYNETLSFRSLFEILKDTFNDYKVINDILIENNIYGVFDEYHYGSGKSYVFTVYKPDILKISNVDMVN